MKKLVLFAAVAFAASMVSCGGSEKAADATDDNAAVEAVDVVEATVDSVAADSVVVDSAAAVVAEVVE